MPAFKASSHAARARVATRRRALLVVTVASMLVVPVAISWACGPNRAIQLDRHEYAPGATVTVSGSNFIEDIDVSINVNGSPVTSARTDATGHLRASFSAPSAAGSYTVVTSGTDHAGQALAGTGVAQTFTVTAPASPPATGGNTPSGAKSPAAPGKTTGAQPGTTRQNGSNTTSGRERSRSGGGGGSRADRGSSGAGNTGSAGAGAGTGASNTTAGVIQAAGRTAFAGSVTRKDRAAAARDKSRAGSASKARPTNRTATADLWSGFASGKNPSLMPNTGAAGAPAAGTSAGVVAGLALLGVGLLALIGLGGLVAAGRRKGRSQAS